MNKNLRLSINFLIFFILAIALWLVFWRGNPNALWHIVNQQCVPNQKQKGVPAPCLKVDLAEHYVLFKDKKGPYHDLIMPTDKVSGIESQALQVEQVPAYVSHAWKNRDHISAEMGKQLKDPWISLAINSKYGRSQNQLHIHVACLRQDVYNVLNKQEQHIDQHWRPLAEKLVGHQYLVKKLAGTDLTKENPFRLLQNYAAEQGDSIGNYGLALTVTSRGEIILLANRLKLTDLNLGSAGEIQDYQCAIAGN